MVNICDGCEGGNGEVRGAHTQPSLHCLSSHANCPLYRVLCLHCNPSMHEINVCLQRDTTQIRLQRSVRQSKGRVFLVALIQMLYHKSMFYLNSLQKLIQAYY